MKLRSILTAAIAALALVGTSASAVTLDMSSPYLLGKIADGVPPSQANETLWVNTLVTWFNSSAPNGTSAAVGSETVTLMYGASLSAPLPSPAIFDHKVESDVTDMFNASGYSYVLGKFGGGQSQNQISVVWYIGGLTDVQIASVLNLGTAGNSGGLSHYTLFGPSTTRVPDGGLTLGLLGLGMAAIAGFRRFARR